MARFSKAPARPQPSQPRHAGGKVEKPPSERDIDALIAFIESRHDVPHAWGRHANDCVSFFGGAVEALTGGRRQPLRGLDWTGEAAGMKLLTRLGGLAAALDARFKRIEPAMAQRGDIAGIADPVLGLHPMIVEGLTLVGPGERGNRRLPRRAMTAAWSATERPKRKKRARG